nr:hypothetical protein [Candidatus Sigynarchaeum springense]
MTLSARSIELLRDKSERDLWNLVFALQHVQNAIFQLEKDERNPEVLKELSAKAIDVGHEVVALLSVLEEKLDD